MKVYVVVWTTLCHSYNDDETSATTNTFGAFHDRAQARIAMKDCQEMIYEEATTWDEDPVVNQVVIDSIEHYGLTEDKVGIEYTNVCGDTIEVTIEVIETELN